MGRERGDDFDPASGRRTAPAPLLRRELRREAVHSRRRDARFRRSFRSLLRRRARDAAGRRGRRAGDHGRKARRRAAALPGLQPLRRGADPAPDPARAGRRGGRRRQTAHCAAQVHGGHDEPPFPRPRHAARGERRHRPRVRLGQHDARRNRRRGRQPSRPRMLRPELRHRPRPRLVHRARRLRHARDVGQGQRSGEQRAPSLRRRHVPAGLPRLDGQSLRGDERRGRRGRPDDRHLPLGACGHERGAEVLPQRAERHVLPRPGARRGG